MKHPAASPLRLLVLAALGCGFAHAGDEPGTSGWGSLGPVVIVTAERRAQSPEKIPVSVAAFSGKELDAAKAGSLIELQKLVPGLTVTEASTGHGQAYIRGVGTDIVGAGVEGAVAVYVDGVYQSRSIGETMRFLDVERVEVLKGPQGVLYGRNATGGAINIVSRAPSRRPTASVDVQAGSYKERIVRGTLSGPLAEGAAYGRLAMLSSSNDGDMRNVLLDTRTNNSGIRSLRGALELTPSDTCGVTLAATYYRDDFSPALKPLAPAVNPLFTLFHAQVIDDPRTVAQNQTSAIKLTQAGVDATAKWDLESARLTSISAFRNIDYQVGKADLDGTEIPVMNVGAPTTGSGILETTRYFSQDFTLASDEQGPWTWTGLLSFSHQKTDAPGFNMALPLFGLSQNSVAAVTSDALSLGAQTTYALGDGWRLTGGGRYSQETKKLDSLQRFTNDVLTASMSARKRWSAVTPKAVIDYSPDRHTMLYASATKGFKSGGFNTTSVQPGFDPETAISYEAGVKGMWLNNRLQASLAAFRTQYRDMQISVVLEGGGVISSTIRNAAKAEIRGIEANLAAHPTPRLSLSAGFQLLHARFVEFTSVDARYPAAGPMDQSGNPLSRAPDVTASLALQYTWPVQDGAGRMTLRGEDAYRSKIYYTPFKNDEASSPGLSVISAMLSYETLRKSGWYGSLFVKNLTNRTYTSNVFDPQSLGYLAYYAPARTTGIRVGYRY